MEPQRRIGGPHSLTKKSRVKQSRGVSGVGHILQAKAGPRGAIVVFKSVELEFATVQHQRREEGTEDLTLRSSVPLAISTQTQGEEKWEAPVCAGGLRGAFNG